MSPTAQLKNLYSSFFTETNKKRINIVSKIVNIELEILKKEHRLPRYSASYISREILLIKKVLMLNRVKALENIRYLEILDQEYLRYLKNRKKY